MKDIFISIRNSISRAVYRFVVKPVFFRFHPEHMHHWALTTGKILGSNPITRVMTRFFFSYQHPMLTQEIHGITFKNPVGLAAGFDKDAELTNIMPEVGFGFEEVGSITGEQCDGNPGRHLWRLPKSNSLVVYYGLKNDGAEAISKRLAGKKFKIPIGISIAKTNCQITVDTTAGVADYTKAYRLFKDIGDYITVNVSCPNAYGGQPFHDKASLETLLTALEREAKTKPVFVKISPDLTNEQVDDILEVVKKFSVEGFVISNLTKERTNHSIIESYVPDVGGLSGKVVEQLADNMISYVYTKTEGTYTIIGCGGIFTAEDAYNKIKNGASLVQLITGMIYQGPQTVAEINHGLIKLLKQDDYKNISEAVGKNHKNNTVGENGHIE